MSRILMVAAEMAPFAKVGGLGDAVYALSMALAAAGHDVRVVLPCYGSIDRKAFGLRPAASLEVPMGVLGRIAVTVLQGETPRSPAAISSSCLPGSSPAARKYDELYRFAARRKTAATL